MKSSEPSENHGNLKHDRSCMRHRIRVIPRYRRGDLPRIPGRRRHVPGERYRQRSPDRRNSDCACRSPVESCSYHVADVSVGFRTTYSGGESITRLREAGTGLAWKIAVAMALSIVRRKARRRFAERAGCRFCAVPTIAESALRRDAESGLSALTGRSDAGSARPSGGQRRSCGAGDRGVD